MKTTIIAILAATLFVACSKKEEAKPAEPAQVIAPTPAAPAASEPAKTEEAKK
jgi:hypothetical protein